MRKATIFNLVDYPSKSRGGFRDTLLRGRTILRSGPTHCIEGIHSNIYTKLYILPKLYFFKESGKHDISRLLLGHAAHSYQKSIAYATRRIQTKVYNYLEKNIKYYQPRSV